jgi:hypothetical protein
LDGCRGLGAEGLDETEDLPRRQIDPVPLERDAVVGLVVQVDLVGLFKCLEREPHAAHELPYLPPHLWKPERTHPMVEPRDAFDLECAPGCRLVM